jgi:V/A-type H+/Na+-transporting ATPase subunit C
MPKNVFVGTTAAALKGTLFDRGTTEKMAEATSLEELVNRLKGTSYANYVGKLSPPFTARSLELAFRERLADVHNLIVNLAKEYDLLSSYYMRQIAWDLKSVLKSKALSKGTDESMEYLTMHAEELVGRRELIVRIVSARDIQEVPSLMAGTEFSKDVADAVSLFTTRKEIRIFDLFIDHAVWSGIASAYGRQAKEYASSRAIDIAGIREMVTLDINSFNILSILRSKLWKIPEEEMKELIVTPTSSFSRSNVQELLAIETVAEASKLLEGTLPQTVGLNGTDEEIVDSIEDYFVSESLNVAKKSFVWQGVGLSYALALTKLLEFEVRNLAAISIGIEAGVEARTVLSKLVM